jgi:hypothetical protein
MVNEMQYGRARLTMLKHVVTAWVRCGGTAYPQPKEARKLYRIWKRAELELLNMFGGHKEEARMAGPIKAHSERGQRPKHSTWGVRL